MGAGACAPARARIALPGRRGSSRRCRDASPPRSFSRSPTDRSPQLRRFTTIAPWGWFRPRVQWNSNSGKLFMWFRAAGASLGGWVLTLATFLPLLLPAQEYSMSVFHPLCGSRGNESDGEARHEHQDEDWRGDRTQVILNRLPHGRICRGLLPGLEGCLGRLFQFRPDVFREQTSVPPADSTLAIQQNEVGGVRVRDG